MHWFVVHTKPKQELRALENLVRQGYECYLPTVQVEKIRRGKLHIAIEPLFPRYLFIRLGFDGTAQGWGSIRSTKGVTRLVTFGNVLAEVGDSLIESIRNHANVVAAEPQPLFKQGERVMVTQGPFAGIQGIYQITDGEKRALILIDFLSKQPRLDIPLANLRKAT